MTRVSFNRGWTVRPRTSLFGEVSGNAPAAAGVTLPHDAMIVLDRSAEHSGGAETGYFPDGVVEYVKSFEVPESYRDKRVILEFEGVYRDAQVYVNGAFAGQRPYGYSLFRVSLDPFLRHGQANEVRVEARAHSDSRWYSGLGIHRPVSLIVNEPVHIAADGVRITTPDVDDERAVVAVATDIVNSTPHTVTVELVSEVMADGERVARNAAPVTVRPGETATARQRLYVGSPRRWGVDHPHLYRLRTGLWNANTGLEEVATDFGIRTIQVDPTHGLRINGATVKLRGACIHHDNGILGAAAISRAEERRVEILKGAGFNAVRASHNPLSKAMLHACDRLGMLVLDEAFDVWTHAKMPFDYSLAFPEWWQRDIESMVKKDFNHPSVILYSIGNEIPDLASPLGSAWSRDISEKIGEIDGTRFTTNAVNGFLAVMSDLVKQVDARPGPGQTGGLNTMMASIGDVLDQINASEIVSERTREAHAVVDVSGLNYGASRYEIDRDLFPDRVILGTESHGPRIDRIWHLVEENSRVIGDFTWTGWDYLGEAGIGRVSYPGEQSAEGGLLAPFPSILAGSGDIDITGFRRPMSYFRETVFGLRSQPYVAVHRPQYHGRKRVAGPWSWSDTVSSWAWGIASGSPVVVEVYSNAEEVELLLNTRSLGRKSVGSERAFSVFFDCAYEPGRLTAVAYTAGVEQGRTSLQSSEGGTRLAVRADRTTLRADDTDLAFLEIELVDTAGTCLVDRELEIVVVVEGPAVLQALGSARPDTEERYDGHTHRTYDGRLLAVVRPVAVGAVVVKATAESLASEVIRLDVVPSDSPPTKPPPVISVNRPA
ncbi:glycoside hydrolase family 2 sugar binding [Parafrankia sp. EAN1pec]|nr:glycoside hydrolase family 2 sugar binding [Frankia sp. EAN1pec]